jgi:hypothetical protein
MGKTVQAPLFVRVGNVLTITLLETSPAHRVVVE